MDGIFLRSLGSLRFRTAVRFGYAVVPENSLHYRLYCCDSHTSTAAVMIPTMLTAHIQSWLLPSLGLAPRTALRSCAFCVVGFPADFTSAAGAAGGRGG